MPYVTININRKAYMDSQLVQLILTQVTLKGQFQFHSNFEDFYILHYLLYLLYIVRPYVIIIKHKEEITYEESNSTITFELE